MWQQGKMPNIKEKHLQTPRLQCKNDVSHKQLQERDKPKHTRESK